MGMKVDKTVSIPSWELVFTTSRSSGPGGQHVNKVNSRVTLHFNVVESSSLTDQQKRRILTVYRTKVNKDGILQLHSQKNRSQSANRVDLVERLRALVGEAVKPKPPRVPTKVSRGIKERRLQEKKRQSQRKRVRSSPSPEE